MAFTRRSRIGRSLDAVQHLMLSAGVERDHTNHVEAADIASTRVAQVINQALPRAARPLQAH